MRTRQPGEQVQIDHMRVGFTEGFGIKKFKAAGPVGLVALKAYSRATSRCAKDFLAHLIEPTRFKIRSIQDNGGSEFRDAFEQTRQALDLPPEQPEWKDCVERANAVVMSAARCMKAG